MKIFKKSLFVMLLFLVYFCSTENDSITSLIHNSNNSLQSLNKLDLDGMTNAEIHNYLLDFISDKLDQDSIIINANNQDERSKIIDSTMATIQRLGTKYGFDTYFSEDVISLIKNLDGPANSIFETAAYQNMYNQLTTSWHIAIFDSIYSAYKNNVLNVPKNFSCAEEEDAWAMVDSSYNWWIVEQNGSSNTTDSWSGLVIDACGIPGGPIAVWSSSIMWEVACTIIGDTWF